MRDVRAGARDERGQATVELIGMLPFLVLAALVVWQLLLVGYSITSAENAARAASRVAARGGDGEKAAKRVIGSPLREGIKVKMDGTKAMVSVRVPLLVPGIGDDDFVVRRDAELPG
jgi:pilus assembly protein CpaE